MSAATLRNVAIVLALAAIVAFVPQGGDTADFVYNVLSLAIGIMFVLLVGRFYQANRLVIYGLGERHRALLYGAVAVAVFGMAARGRMFDSSAGIFGWFVLMGGASYALYAVWRRHRSYGI